MKQRSLYSVVMTELGGDAGHGHHGKALPHVKGLKPIDRCVIEDYEITCDLPKRSNLDSDCHVEDGLSAIRELSSPPCLK